MAGGRRVARELAVIVMPQLPKDKVKLEKTELEVLVSKAVHILTEYAKQNLAEAEAELTRANDSLQQIELDHPKNARAIEKLESVPLTTEQFRAQIEKVSRALVFVSEALDIPDAALHAGRSPADVACKNCGHLTQVFVERASGSDIRDYAISLVEVYLEHKADIDTFIKSAKAKWNLDRMFSVDRDILRLACAEALYMHEVPVNVAVSEAIELCHRFADERAAKFVNGVLGFLAKEAKRFRLQGEFSNLAELPTDGEVPDLSDIQKETDEDEVFEPARRGTRDRDG